MRLFTRVSVCLLAASLLTLAGCTALESLFTSDPKLDAAVVQADLEQAEQFVVEADARLELLEQQLADLETQLSDALAIGDSDIAAAIAESIGRVRAVIAQRTELRDAALASIERLEDTLAAIEADGDDGVGETLQVAGALTTEAGTVAAVFNPAVGAAIGTVGSVLGAIGGLFGRLRGRQLVEVVSAIDVAKDGDGTVRFADQATKETLKANMKAKTRYRVKTIQDKATRPLG